MTTVSEPTFDVSLVINVHHSRPFLARTIRSFEEAARFARTEGLRIEAVLTLDRPHPETLQWIKDYDCCAFDGVQVITVDNGSLGLSRNDGMKAARGEYVMLGDDDDLVSFNSIFESFQVARSEGPRCVVVPQYVISFGAKHVLAKYSGSDVVSPHAFIKYHPYISRLFVHNSIKRAASYIEIARDSGYAYEDWHFNATLCALGYRFRNAPDTILFYRQRPDGLLQSADIESTRQIPPSPLFDPRTYMRICKDSDFSLAQHVPTDLDLEKVRHIFFASPLVRELMKAARQIEPAISQENLRTAPVTPNTAGDLTLGKAYLRACEIVKGRRFTDVLLVPFPAPAVAVAHLTDVLDSLGASDPATSLLVVSAAPADYPRSFGSHLPNAVYVPLETLEVGLNSDSIDTIALRLIESTAGTARLHIVPGNFPHRFFVKYRRLLRRNRSYYYRFDQISSDGGDFQFMSAHIDDLDAVLIRKDSDLDFIRARIDRHPEKWRLLRPRCARPVDTPGLDAASTARRILYWNVGKLQEQPALVLSFAQRLCAADPRIQVDVFMGENAHSNEAHRISRYPNMRLVTRVGHDSETGTRYDSIISEYHHDPGWPVDAGLYPAPMFLVRLAAGQTAKITEVEAGLIVQAPSPERAAATLARTVLRMYEDAVWFERLRNSVCTRAENRYGERAFATMVASAFR